MKRRSFFGTLLVAVAVVAACSQGPEPASTHSHLPYPRQDRLRIAILTAPTSATATRISVSDQDWVNLGDVLVVGTEAMRAVSLKPAITVSRGMLGTRALHHETGDQVFIGTSAQFYLLDPARERCGHIHVQVVPYISIQTGRRWVCPYPESDWIEVPQ